MFVYGSNPWCFRGREVLAQLRDGIHLPDAVAMVVLLKLGVE